MGRITIKRHIDYGAITYGDDVEDSDDDDVQHTNSDDNLTEPGHRDRARHTVGE